MEQEKKPRLFYYEEADSAYIPAPEKVKDIIDEYEDDDPISIEFRWFLMTDEEFNNLPVD